MHKFRFLAVSLVALAAASAGCAPVALTALGVGSATAVNHTLTGVTYRTFTIPADQVKTASLTALNRMGIAVGSVQQQEGRHVVKASGTDRDIEIVLEPISVQTTRMRVIARNSGGILYDSAPATEIILQTEKVLANGPRRS